MFVKFLIFFGIIATAGPGHIEGGFEAIENKGAKTAVVQALNQKDTTTLIGNYGNQ